MTAFGDRAFVEVIKIKRGHKGGALRYDGTGVLIRRGRDIRAHSLSEHSQKKGIWRHSEKIAIYKPGRESSPET